MSRKGAATQYDSDEDSSGWLSDYSSDEDEYGTSSSQQQTATGQANNVNEMTEAEYGEEAPIKYDTVSYFFNKRVRPSELYNPRTGALLNEGKITLSFSKGDLTLDEHTNPNDFETKDAAADLLQQQQQQTALDARQHGKKARSHHQRKYKPRKKRVRHDMFKSAHLREFMTNWEGPIGVALPTVRALAGEGYYMRSPVVCKTFSSGVMSATEARDYQIADRRPTKGMVIFNNMFENRDYKKDVCYMKDQVLLPYNSPWTMYHNDGEPAEKHYNGPSTGFEKTGQIMVPMETFRKYEAITDKEIMNKISLADVTDDVQLTFFVPAETGSRINQHAQFMQTGQGIPWDNFADHKSQIPLSKLSQLSAQSLDDLKNEYNEREIWLRGKVEFKYRHCNGRKIEMDTRKKI